MSCSAETDRLWEQVLDFIAEGRVVPIVSRDLVTPTIRGRQVGLYVYLAERLAQHFSLPKDGASETASLNVVACRYLARGGQLEDIYPAVKKIMPGPGEATTPNSLQKLAQIDQFNLFVSTTLDPFLQAAVDGVRFGGRGKTLVFAYSPLDPQDLPVETLERPAVYHMFGRLSSVPDYAVTDEDVLEFMHCLQSETRRPERLIDELVTRQLLFIGCAFSDWLARFFIRIRKRERLRCTSRRAASAAITA